MYFPFVLHRVILDKSVNDFYGSSFHTLDSILNQIKKNYCHIFYTGCYSKCKSFNSQIFKILLDFYRKSYVLYNMGYQIRTEWLKTYRGRKIQVLIKKITVFFVWHNYGKNKLGNLNTALQ
jgi:hypothetical protein